MISQEARDYWKQKVLIFLIILLFGIVSFWFDESVLSFVNSMRSPLLDVVMLYASEIAGITLGIPLIILIVLVLRHEHKRKLLKAFLLGLFLDLVVVGLLKITIKRSRPKSYDFLMKTEAFSYSFPSSHSSRAFFMFSILSKYFNYKVFFYSAAFLVAFSRIYLQVHYLSDVIFGALIGLILSELMYWVVEKDLLCLEKIINLKSFLK